MTERDEAEPLLDTWEARKDAATWIITGGRSHEGLSSAEINAWFADAFTATMAAFAGFARAARVTLRLPDQPSLELSRGEAPEDAFNEEVVRTLRASRDPVLNMNVILDLRVWVRTKRSPDRPERVWIAHPEADFVFFGGPDDDSPCVALGINHTLFADTAWGDAVERNAELYALNHPLLERALRAWEERLGGAIKEFYGRLLGIERYGFRPWNEP